MEDVENQSQATAQLRAVLSLPSSYGDGRFLVLSRDHWQRLWDIPTTNRLNLIAAYLVLLAGSNYSSRITTWSASACERYVGIGAPRARIAIRELIQGGLAEPASGPRSERVRYRLAPRLDTQTPIFMPMRLVTGLYEDQASMLKEARQSGDEMALRLLVDLHGMVQPDATFGMPLDRFRQCKDAVSRRVKSEDGYTVWELRRSGDMVAAGDWCAPHVATGDNGQPDWTRFWQRLETVRGLDVFWFDPWVFDSEAMDAEPILPIAGFPGGVLTEQLLDCDILRRRLVRALTGIEEKPLEREVSDNVYIVLPDHHGMPALRGVARLWNEADTPGRRRALEQRERLIARQAAEYKNLLDDLGVCDTWTGFDD